MCAQEFPHFLGTIELLAGLADEAFRQIFRAARPRMAATANFVQAHLAATLALAADVKHDGGAVGVCPCVCCGNRAKENASSKREASSLMGAASCKIGNGGKIADFPEIPKRSFSGIRSMSVIGIVALGAADRSLIKAQQLSMEPRVIK